MGEVEVDALNVGVEAGDHVDVSADVSADVDEHPDVVEAVVFAQEMLDDEGGDAFHRVVEHLAEPRIAGLVLERRHAVRRQNRVAAVQDRLLQAAPVRFVVKKKKKFFLLYFAKEIEQSVRF